MTKRTPRWVWMTLWFLAAQATLLCWTVALVELAFRGGVDVRGFLVRLFPSVGWLRDSGGLVAIVSVFSGVLLLTALAMGPWCARLMAIGNAVAVVVLFVTTRQVSVRGVGAVALVLSTVTLFMPGKDPRPERTKERRRAAAVRQETALRSRASGGGR